jgi:hypothetical protein
MAYRCSLVPQQPPGKRRLMVGCQGMQQQVNERPVH